MTTSGILGVFTPRDYNQDHTAKFGRSWIRPGDDEHTRLISPSKIATILTRDGHTLSRYESPFRLWHRMKGVTPGDPPKDEFDVGHDMEPYAANRWRRRNDGWLLSRNEVQFHIDPDKYGFPAVATLDRRGVRGRSRRVVELKCARGLSDLEMWGDDLSGDCPEDYAAQVISQQMFSGWTDPADLLVIGPYYQDRIYQIEYDTGIASWIIAECRRFYESLAGAEPPPLDDTKATYECLRQLHPDIDGSSAVLDPDEAIAFLDATAAAKVAADALQFEKSMMLKRMEDAQYAVVGDKRVAERRNNGKGGVSFYTSKGVTADDIRSIAGGSK